LSVAAFSRRRDVHDSLNIGFIVAERVTKNQAPRDGRAALLLSPRLE
jgi:hypothetical protein